MLPKRTIHTYIQLYCNCHVQRQCELLCLSQNNIHYILHNLPLSYTDILYTTLINYDHIQDEW